MTEEINDIHTLRFIELLRSLDEATMAFLGKKAHPGTGKVETNLPMARWNIDVLTALEAKSEGNRGDLEEKYLQQILSRLRLNYVDMADGAPDEKAGEEGDGEAGETSEEKKDTPAEDDDAGKAQG